MSRATSSVSEKPYGQATVCRGESGGSPVPAFIAIRLRRPTRHQHDVGQGGRCPTMI